MVARWNWYNAMDGMLSETAKANGVSMTNDQGAPVDVGDNDGCGAILVVVICTTNLSGFHGKPTKDQWRHG